MFAGRFATSGTLQFCSAHGELVRYRGATAVLPGGARAPSRSSAPTSPRRLAAAYRVHCWFAMAQPQISIVRSPDPTHPEPEAPVERYQHGWRSGKPVEDPEKLKRWGTVGAKPSEYLVCTRRGDVDPRRSGQGRRIFKWPWESIAIVPTTLQRIEFTADQ